MDPKWVSFFSSDSHYVPHICIHWASKETSHFFRVTFTEIHCIKLIHIWTQIRFNTILNKHISEEIQDITRNQRRRSIRFQKSQKGACFSGWEFESQTTASPVASVYVTRLLIIEFNSYSFNVLNRPVT